MKKAGAQAAGFFRLFSPMLLRPMLLRPMPHRIGLLMAEPRECAGAAPPAQRFSWPRSRTAPRSAEVVSAAYACSACDT